MTDEIEYGPKPVPVPMSEDEVKRMLAYLRTALKVPQKPDPDHWPNARIICTTIKHPDTAIDRVFRWEGGEVVAVNDDIIEYESFAGWEGNILCVGPFRLRVIKHDRSRGVYYCVRQERLH